ncbi:MAG: KH domain-containing protein [Actinobacteria bacterium]|nr:KH domain-containing protein [Actinomycetota bacterium]
MKELLEYIAKALVDEPDKVEVNEVGEGRSIILQLKVSETDVGKVIGKKGRIANALRVIIKAVATKNGKVAIVQIID